MKINKTPQLALLTLLFISITAMFTACSKGNDVAPNATANIMAVNAVEGSASQDLYLDNVKLNSSAVAYGQSSDLLTAQSGNHQAKFTNTGSATANVSFNVSLQAGNQYTFYFTGNDTTQTSFVTQDDMTAPPAGQARVRFVQLSTAVKTAVDFGTSSSAKLVTGLAYKTASAYYNVSANTTFMLFAAGSLNTTLSIPTSIQAGKIYTIYVSGSSMLTLTYHVIAED